MKAVFVALFACVAVASASVLIPQTYSYGLGYASPYTTLGYAAPYAAPYAATYGIASPWTYAATPVAYTAPAVQSGYVAATRGSVHTAPLPEGPLAFSHHLNTAPAPGTL